MGYAFGAGAAQATSQHSSAQRSVFLVSAFNPSPILCSDPNATAPSVAAALAGSAAAPQHGVCKSAHAESKGTVQRSPAPFCCFQLTLHLALPALSALQDGTVCLS
eukprot:2043007-Pleurochrysis_carterae.AAC.2